MEIIANQIAYCTYQTSIYHTEISLFQSHLIIYFISDGCERKVESDDSTLAGLSLQPAVI